jgi:hypothetical protein
MTENDQAINSGEHAHSPENSRQQNEASFQDLHLDYSSSVHDSIEDEENVEEEVPVPTGPDLGFVPDNDLSNLHSALEESADTPDYEPESPETAAFDLFDDEQALSGSEDFIRDHLRYRFGVAISNHYDLTEALFAATRDSSQALYDLAAIQNDLRTEEEQLQLLLNQTFRMVRKRKDIIKDVMGGGPLLSKEMWEEEWGQEWISDDEEKEDELRELEQQRKLRRKEEQDGKRASLDKGKGRERCEPTIVLAI